MGEPKQELVMNLLRMGEPKQYLVMSQHNAPNAFLQAGFYLKCKCTEIAGNVGRLHEREVYFQAYTPPIRVFDLSSYIKNKNKTYVQSFEYMMASSKPYFI